MDKVHPIMIVDDHPVVIAGLQQLLAQLPEVEIAVTAANAFEAMQGLKNNKIEVVLLDINLPDINGIELCKKIKKEFPAIKILGLSTFGDRGYISRMIESGASGYLMKSSSAAEIAEAIKTVLEGRLYLSLSTEHLLRSDSAELPGGLPSLTRREKEVLALIAEGLTNHQIAEKLFISPLTVDSHRKNLLTKLKVNNTASLVRLAMQHGLI